MSEGVIVLNGRGSYTKNNKKVLYIVIYSKEIVKPKNIIKEVGEDAYLTMHKVHEMMGKGIRETKTN